MATISKGIKLFMGEDELTNLQEIPELGEGETDTIEITCLSDEYHVYTDGLKNYADTLSFKFLYENEQFTMLNSAKGVQNWKVELPDTTTCEFSGTCSVKLDGAGLATVMTYTLNIKPKSEFVWA